MHRNIVLEIIDNFSQGISPGLVKTEMSVQFNLGELDENNEMLAIDITNAILYALGTPQRVNVSRVLQLYRRHSIDWSDNILK